MKLGYHLSPWLREGPLAFHHALDEICMTGWDGLELVSSWATDGYCGSPADMGKLLAHHDLELSASWCAFSYLPERREQEAKEVRRFIDGTAGAGGKILLIDGGPRPPGQATDDDIKHAAEFANMIGGWAREAGLQCCWHQHWGTCFQVQATFDRLMELTDPELLKFCPDTAQLLFSEFDVVGMFRKYARRIGYVHFKDVDLNRNWELSAKHGGPTTWTDVGGYNIDSKYRMVELGRGLIDYPTLVAILRDVGYEGWIVDDFDYIAYGTRDVSIALLRYLRNGLGIIGRRGSDGWAG